MELRNLKTFLQVVESGSFTRAAELLGYTQSAVSLQMQQLEEELGVSLFDRIGRKIFLTERGRLLEKHACGIVDSVDTLREDFLSEGTPSGIVHLATADSVLERMMIENYEEFRNIYPDIRLVFSSGTTQDLMDVLERNEADAIFTLDTHVYRKNFVIARESQVKLRFVAAPFHPLAAKSGLTLADIAAAPLMLTEKGMSYRKVLDDCFARMSLEAHPVLETGRTDIIIRFAAKGLGVAFLPEFVIRRELRAGHLVTLDVTDAELSIWKQLIYRKDKWMSKAFISFIEFVKAHEFEW
ncbi:MAG: LysR family transcriptional regulator [Clostridia bacterium]|nr:LysR family transcriptional regulator [Clostridia bacterium]